MDTSDDDSDGDNHPIHNPLKPCIIRECYKFLHAPSQDGEISTVTYNRARSLQYYHQPTVDHLFADSGLKLIPQISPPLSDSQRHRVRQTPRATPSACQEETSGNAAGLEDVNSPMSLVLDGGKEMGLTNAMRDNSGGVDSMAMDTHVSMSSKQW